VDRILWMGVLYLVAWCVAQLNRQNSQKKSRQAAFAEGFNSGVKGLT
jgi:uncharacterized membrane protein YhdT